MSAEYEDAVTRLSAVRMTRVWAARRRAEAPCPECSHATRHHWRGCLVAVVRNGHLAACDCMAVSATKAPGVGRGRER